MKRKVFLLGILFLISYLCVNQGYAQLDSTLMEDHIAQLKKSVTLIISKDDTILHRTPTDTLPHRSYGTGVYIKYKGVTLLVTCEHVVAIKDSLENTIRYVEKIFHSINLEDGGKHQFPAFLLHADEENDFAILALGVLKKESHLWEKTSPITYQESFWLKKRDLQEGNFIIYTGHPLGLGMQKMNYPLSRTGIISQLILEEHTFLIDGFVQRGHSGSPVFVIKGKKSYLAGIILAHPFRINPGFAIVQSMDKIEEVVREIYENKIYERPFKN